jgi:hypothetical protein
MNGMHMGSLTKLYHQQRMITFGEFERIRKEAVVASYKVPMHSPVSTEEK